MGIVHLQKCTLTDCSGSQTLCIPLCHLGTLALIEEFPSMALPNEIRVSDSTFWVVHRGREFGPFDYEWSMDLRGLELTYCGEKFGEVCSNEEVYADLAPFRLPMSVCRAAIVTAGSIVVGITESRTATERLNMLRTELHKHELSRFRIVDVNHHRLK